MPKNFPINRGGRPAVLEKNALSLSHAETRKSFPFDYTSHPAPKPYNFLAAPQKIPRKKPSSFREERRGRRGKKKKGIKCGSQLEQASGDPFTSFSLGTRIRGAIKRAFIHSSKLFGESWSRLGSLVHLGRKFVQRRDEVVERPCFTCARAASLLSLKRAT